MWRLRFLMMGAAGVLWLVACGEDPVSSDAGDAMSIAAHSTVVPDVSTIGASDGTSVVQVTVTVLDGNDDPVTGAVVTLGVSGTGNTVTDPPAPTGSSGRATGSFSSTVAEEKIVFFDSSDDPNCPGLCSNDAGRGGTTDGAGAYVHDGTAGLFEMSHPVSSGDPLDIDFASGSRARVTLTLRLCGDPTCSTVRDTNVGAGTPLMLLVQ